MHLEQIDKMLLKSIITELSSQKKWRKYAIDKNNKNVGDS